MAAWTTGRYSLLVLALTVLAACTGGSADGPVDSGVAGITVLTASCPVVPEAETCPTTDAGPSHRGPGRQERSGSQRG